MRRVTLTIREQDLDDVLDRLLPIVPQGVHPSEAAGGRLELVVYGAEPGRAELEAAAGAALQAVAEGEAPDDPAERRLAAFAQRPPIGGRIVVRPEGAPPAPEGLLDVVIADSGGAFGAGTHPTTVLCLEALLGLEPGGSFADLGCGTGVLAIVAGRLGWGPPLLALDHEPIAVAATVANARRNGVAVEALQADLLEVAPPPAATIFANVPVAVHEKLASALAPETRILVASGIVDEHVARVVAAYTQAGLQLVDHAVVRGWAAALLVRP
jgi:ribosomal protein L11 methyltransferase